VRAPPSAAACSGPAHSWGRTDSTSTAPADSESSASDQLLPASSSRLGASQLEALLGVSSSPFAPVPLPDARSGSTNTSATPADLMQPALGSYFGVLSPAASGARLSTVAQAGELSQPASLERAEAARRRLPNTRPARSIPARRSSPDRDGGGGCWPGEDGGHQPQSKEVEKRRRSHTRDLFSRLQTLVGLDLPVSCDGGGPGGADQGSNGGGSGPGPRTPPSMTDVLERAVRRIRRLPGLRGGVESGDRLPWCGGCGECMACEVKCRPSISNWLVCLR
jgi:hypothetical protein